MLPRRASSDFASRTFERYGALALSNFERDRSRQNPPAPRYLQDVSLQSRQEEKLDIRELYRGLSGNIVKEAPSSALCLPASRDSGLLEDEAVARSEYPRRNGHQPRAPFRSKNLGTSASTRS